MKPKESVCPALSRPALALGAREEFNGHESELAGSQVVKVPKS